MRRLLLLAVLCCALLAGARAVPATATSPQAPAAEASLIELTLREIHRQQAAFHRALANDVRAVGREGTVALLAVCLTAFLYGVFHAAGPGHGKAVIGAYLLTRGGTLRDAIWLSTASALLQAVVAVAAVGVIVLLFGLSRTALVGGERWFEAASYAVICGVGLWMAANAIRGKDCEHDHGHGPGHGHGHGHDHAHAHGHGHTHGPDCAHGHAQHDRPSPATAPPLGQGRRERAGLVLASGMRPCTGAILLLLLAASNQVFWAGVVGTFAMAVGTALTVGLIAAAAQQGRRGMLAAAAAGGWQATLHRVLAACGAFAIAALGGLLCASALHGSGSGA